MKAGILRVALLAASLMLLAPSHASTADVGRLLAEADHVRTTDPSRFAELLARIVEKRAHASESQQRHLRLLQSHQRALLGQPEAAIGEAVALVDQAPEPELRYRAALLVANVSAINRDYVLGLRYLERAIAMQDKVHDADLRHVGHVVAGTLFNEFGHFDKALEHADDVLAEGASPRNRCIAQQIRARAALGLGRPLDEARDLQRPIADCVALKEMIAASALRATMAEYRASQGQTREAIRILEGTLPDVLATRYPRLIAEVRSLLARYALERGDAMAADAHARAVVDLPGADPRSLAHVLAQKVLYQLALDRQNLGAALRHYRLYAEADKARMEDMKAREYAAQLIRYEVAQKNQSIELLSNENQLLLLQQEVAERKSWNFRLAIALLLVITASAAYWGWRARRTHRNLRQLANTDVLTGLSNRRHFRARSEAVLALCAQRNRPVSMLLFDLDHFKQINDQCGHSSGDWVLREVARVGRQHCREGDLYGRIGGEEFAMTLVDCDMDAALRIAEQCRRSIEGIDAVEGTGCALQVAASIGVVSTSMSGYDYETLVAHADAAMYRSKVAGRNRVSLYEPPPVPPDGQPVTLDGRNAEAMLREY